MVTPMQAIRKVEQEIPERKGEHIYQFGKDYLVLALMKNSDGMDDSDPFFIVDSETGKVKGFIPSRDFKAYEDAMANEIPM